MDGIKHIFGFFKKPCPPAIKCMECNDSGYIDKDNLDEFLEWAEHHYMFKCSPHSGNLVYVAPIPGDNSRICTMIRAYRWWKKYGQVICGCNDFPYEE